MFLTKPLTQKVVTEKETRGRYIAASKSNLTVVLTLSAVGEISPPTIVYPYKRMPRSISISVPEEWRLD